MSISKRLAQLNLPDTEASLLATGFAGTYHLMNNYINSELYLAIYTIPS